MTFVRLFATFALAISLAWPAVGYADPRPLALAEHDEITRLVHAMFDAARDGDAHALANVLPDDAQFARLFMPGTEPLVERHRRAVARALDDLRARFAGGQFVAMRGLDAGSVVHTDRCSPFALPQSECLDGPVIEWTVNGETRRMRINKLVRVDGHWRIFAPRM